jgi:hypothetical protein
VVPFLLNVLTILSQALNGNETALISVIGDGSREIYLPVAKRPDI